MSTINPHSKRLTIMGRNICDTHRMHWEIYYAYPHSGHMLFLDKRCQPELVETDFAAAKIYRSRHNCFEVISNESCVKTKA